MNKKIFFWVIGIVLVTFLTVNAGWGEVKEYLFEIDIWVLLLLCILQLVTRTLISYQWYFLIRKKNLEIDFKKTFLICQAGKFIESVTPSSKLGGEAAKIYLFHRKTKVDYEQLTSLMLVHKYLTMLPFLLLAGVFILAASANYSLTSTVFYALIIFSIVIILCLAFIFIIAKKEKSVFSNNKKDGFIIWEKVKLAVDFFRRTAVQTKGVISHGEQLKLLSISVLVWFFYPVKIYFAAAILGFEISLVFAALVTYSAYLVSMLPLTPGGLGTFEGTMALLFSLNNFQFTEGIAVALLARLVTFWFPLLLSALTSGYLAVKTKGLVFAEK